MINVSKNYMSKNDRSNFLFLNALVAKADEIESELSQHSADKDLMKNLRSGLTWLRKAQQSWATHVDEKTLDKLLRECDLYAVGLIFHRDAQKHITKMEESDRSMRKQAVAELGPDATYDLAEWTLKLACRTCSSSINQRPDGCHIRKTLSALHIPAWNEEHDQCIYSGVGNATEDKYEA